jgi:ferric-dicitrate binding protein FerR (iron transport regulator)
MARNEDSEQAAEATLDAGERRPSATDEGPTKEKHPRPWMRWLSLSEFVKPWHPHRRAAWRPVLTRAVMLPLIFVFALTRMSGDVSTAPTLPTATAPGMLSDGTPMLAERGAIWKERFSAQRREVHLHKGDMLFDVSGDFKRPLVVTTAMVDIAAVDARFAVRLDDNPALQVYRGEVEVSAHGAPKGAPVIRVKQGETFPLPRHGFRAALGARGHCGNSARSTGTLDRGDPRHLCNMGGVYAREGQSILNIRSAQG